MYASREEAARKIPAAIAAYYTQAYAQLAGTRRADIESAGKGILAVYERNVCPELKVTWGSYPTNLGHTSSPGCFRCHDESHATADKKYFSTMWSQSSALSDYWSAYRLAVARSFRNSSAVRRGP